ncbi:MAG TPA: hypothetical protein VH684_10880 [Xanthobacteraceae bacterium]
MPLRFLSSIEELDERAARDVCLIKGAVDKGLCERLIDGLTAWRHGRDSNQGRGANWWYRVNTEGSDLNNFLFYDLLAVTPLGLREDLLLVYRMLFEGHQRCGTLSADNRFEELLAGRGEHPSLSPLVFHYPPGTGSFRRHSHPQRIQVSQLLVNVTKRGRDYLGGETLIEEADGRLVSLGECFDQGDMFAFPFNLFHSVKRVDAAAADSIGRISVLMPFHVRTDTEIRY